MRRYRIPQSVIKRERERSKKMDQEFQNALQSILAEYPADCGKMIHRAWQLWAQADNELKYARCCYTVQDSGVKLFKSEIAHESWKSSMEKTQSLYWQYQELKAQVCETYSVHPDKVAELVKAINDALNQINPCPF